MPSRFPGMDPYIESQRWDDFHSRFVPALGDMLLPQVRPTYTVDVKRYVYLVEQKFLSIRSRERRDFITVIELLSPWNKSPGDGFKEYLQKQSGYLGSVVHIVEIDLLRGGSRLPTIEPLPAGDYFAFVGRWDRRPKLDVYHWHLRDRLPRIPIPLKVGDADAALDLQAAFERTYENAGYDYALDYDVPLDPPLPHDSDA